MGRWSGLLGSAIFVATFVGSIVADRKQPTVLISILARNKAHTLPYFLSLLYDLDYPKDRIALWIRSDHNVDNTLDILRTWISEVKDDYHLVSTDFYDNKEGYAGERGPAHWPSERFERVIVLRENALLFARNMWADYIFSLDCDVFLTNPKTLNILISKKLNAVAPMLLSEGLYSNFWSGMTKDYYYQRTDDYTVVLNREKLGCFHVPMIHSAVLIDLRNQKTDRLTYRASQIQDFDGPNDDMIIFAVGANRSGITLHVCNDVNYGYVMTPLEHEDSLEIDYEQLVNMKLKILLDEDVPLKVDKLFHRFLPPRKNGTLGFDKVFMINLLRRPERRIRMMACFEALDISVTIVDAVDGQSIDNEVLQRISILPDYSDPYRKRPMTMGEIGCFLSHYQVWNQIVTNKYETVLILEDDIRFERFFRIKVRELMNDVNRIPNWDLVYLGRKRLLESEEAWVEGSNLLVEPSYSYWTLGYILSLRGANKLLRADPLNKLVPVDEFLPILFDKHPQSNLKKHFPHRDLMAFSAAPLLVYPTHYTGEHGYISDTEDSDILQEVPKNTRDDL